MSTGSMSVHSLIDNFKPSDRRPPDKDAATSSPSPTVSSPSKTAASTSQTEPVSQPPSVAPKTETSSKETGDVSSRAVPPAPSGSFVPGHPSLQPPVQVQAEYPFPSPQQPPQHPQTPSQRGGSGALTKESILAIVGDDVKELNLSEDALVQIVQLKIEQERTKQQQIKLDLATKNHGILTTALNANIPGYLIAQMCVNPNDQVSPMAPQLGHLSHSSSNSQDFQSFPANYRFGAGSYTQGAGSYTQGTVSTPLMSTPSLPAAPAPPGASSVSLQATRRPLSPAKLGAQAVANLTSPTTSYRFPPAGRKPPIIPSHQRHFSMPVDPGRFKNPSIDLSKVDTHIQSQQQKYYPYFQPSSKPPSQSSPHHHSRSHSIGKTSQSPSHSRSRSISSATAKNAGLGTSTMQVKAAPAQPLSKPGKSAQPPSQESMTSFQHVIQFQHWKPEDPGKEYVERSHKRHKSHADNMSVDMRGEELGDVSMESDKRD